MTMEQIVKAARFYRAQLYEADAESERCDPDTKLSSLLEGERVTVSRNHLAWMCDEILEMSDDGQKREKCMRWICFVQGVLWQLGGHTIDQFKDDNR